MGLEPRAVTTPLGAVLAERIARSGPIPVADFMAAAGLWVLWRVTRSRT